MLLTKSDLADPAVLRERYDVLGRADTGHRSRRDASGDRVLTGLDTVRERLTGLVSVMVGHSGVGKSTIVNALVPDADRATGSVTGVGKGRHTSTSAIALPLPAGGWVIDTPGVRSFGLAHVTPDDLLRGVRRSAGRHRRLPAELRSPRSRVRTGPLGGRRPLESRPVGLIPPAAAVPGRH